MKELTLEEVAAAQDMDLGASSWFKIEQERIDRFAAATEDRQWIHVDVDRASQSELGGTIAHGFLLVSLLPKLFFEVVRFTDMERMINYGVDKVRFISPVPSGSEVQLRTRILSSRRRMGGLLMKIHGEMILRATERRCLVTEMLFLAFPASGSPTATDSKAASDSKT